MYLEIIIVLITLIVYLRYSIQRRPKGFPPGPNGIPILGYAPFLGQYPHLKIGELSQKFGKIYSFFLGSHPVIVLNDVKDIKTALKMDAFSGRPKDKLLAMEVVSDGIVFNEGPTWVEQRRFSVKVLRDFGFGKKSMDDSIQDEVRDLVTHFRQLVNKPTNPRQTLQLSMINALWMIIANEKFSLNDERALHLQRTVHEGFIEPEQNGAAFFLPWLAKLAPKLTGFSKVLYAIEEMNRVLKEVIDDHRRTMTPEYSRDYIDVALKKIDETDDPNSSFYKENGIKHLINTLITFFTAGSDTLTSSMSYMMLYMVNHPEVMKKVQDEITKVVGPTRLPSLNDRSSMPYTEAMLCEVLRLSSILSGSILHSTTEDVVFETFKIPKGTIIMPNLYLIHHDPQHWEEPHKFRPERFLHPDNGSFLKSKMDHLIPFSIGKRVCPAENVAMAEFFVYATGLLQNFSFEAHPDFPLPAMDDPKPGLVLSPKQFHLVFIDRK